MGDKIEKLRQAFEDATSAKRELEAARSKERTQAAILRQSSDPDDVLRAGALAEMDSRWHIRLLHADLDIDAARVAHAGAIGDKEHVRRSFLKYSDAYARLTPFATEFAALVDLLDPLFRQTRGLLPGAGDSHVQSVLVLARKIAAVPETLATMQSQLEEYGDDAPRAGWPG